jgi:hypothetical protein
MYYNPELSYPVPVSPTWGIQDGSKIKAYQECARKYFYEYVLGWRSIHPSNHLIFGSAWHEALAHLYDNGFSAEDVNVAFRDHFLPYYRQFIDPGDDDLYHPKTPERALLALAYYAAVHRHDLSENDILEYDGKKLIEIGGQVSISNEYTVAFKQDTIMKNNRGIFSLEHKTGSSSYNWSTQWELAVSTAIYTHVLYCLFPPEEVSGIKYNATFFKKTKDDIKKDAKDPFRHFDHLRIPIYKSMAQIGTMLTNIIWWLDMISDDFDALADAKDSDPFFSCYPMSPGSCTNWGRICEYHDFCLNWQNPLRHIDRLPMDMKIDFWNPLEEDVRIKVSL